MRILVTGCAGFIGYHLTLKLIENGHNVMGIDNLNDYYDVRLKLDRLKELGIDSDNALHQNKTVASDSFKGFKFVRMSIEDRENLPQLFDHNHFDVVCNLAAQAGVRYSLENPEAYVDSNIVGFLNILECCKNHNIEHLVYASSSSVYGMNKKIPFNTTDSVDHPISLYAASKKSNELMAHTYSHLYGIRTTGLRFFTVYGPWGRPDMAMFLFTEAILNHKPIKVFNHGKLERDFTYIDDIVQGITQIVENKHTAAYNSDNLYHLYNIGNSKSVKLLDFIEAIEDEIGLKASKEMMPMQPGDVEKTWADVSGLERDYNYRPNTPIKSGVKKFVAWYKTYYGNSNE
ncbi:NAD-dependent epimerase/dehydratase family protein [Muricauda sp. HICW]|uniref:NAD-dependent epimerase/dehydratase family protein n=1 Tax=Flagellimonas chongwuensis TaxID=2697365 RepID=A0A850NHP9_9FLAO|nr:NAD-dependent epimerase [Allomuricauda chongwuensis]NVN19309.1 NAD-dependent epimerase/dehydratase family protein [Allomuricauda chongwuensis]